MKPVTVKISAQKDEIACAAVAVVKTEAEGYGALTAHVERRLNLRKSPADSGDGTKELLACSDTNCWSRVAKTRTHTTQTSAGRRSLRAHNVEETEEDLFPKTYHNQNFAQQDKIACTTVAIVKTEAETSSDEKFLQTEIFDLTRRIWRPDNAR